MVGLIFPGVVDAVTCGDETQQDSGDVHRRRGTDSLVRGRRHHGCLRERMADAMIEITALERKWSGEGLSDTPR